MNEQVIKWMNQNAEHIRTAAVVMVIANIIIFCLAGCTGGLVSYFINIVRILFLNVMLAVPCVFAVKIYKESK